MSDGGEIVRFKDFFTNLALQTNFILIISSYSVFGCLIRLVIIELVSIFTTTHLYYVALFFGCFVLGLVNNNVHIFYTSKKDKNGKNLKNAITIGFCGSLTTLSTWLGEAPFKINFLPNNLPIYIYNILETIFTGTSVSFCGYLLGKQLYFHYSLKFIYNLRFILVFFYIFFILFYIFCLVFVIINYKLQDKTYSFNLVSLLLAPFGSLLRWKLTSLNEENKNISSWTSKSGTFLANFIGCLLFGLVSLLQQDINLQNNISVLFLASILEGFCSCLTTVSTFISEMLKMNFNDGFKYYLLTIITCQLVNIIFSVLSFQVNNENN